MIYRTPENLTENALNAAMDAAKAKVFGAQIAAKTAARIPSKLSPLMERIVDVLRDETDPVSAQEIADEIKAPACSVVNAIAKQRGKLPDHGLVLESSMGFGGGYQLRNLA